MGRSQQFTKVQVSENCGQASGMRQLAAVLGVAPAELVRNTRR